MRRASLTIFLNFHGAHSSTKNDMSVFGLSLVGRECVDESVEEWVGGRVGFFCFVHQCVGALGQFFKNNKSSYKSNLKSNLKFNLKFNFNSNFKSN